MGEVDVGRAFGSTPGPATTGAITGFRLKRATRGLVAFLERRSTPERPELSIAAPRAVENNVSWFRLIGVINDERAPALTARVAMHRPAALGASELAHRRWTVRLK